MTHQLWQEGPWDLPKPGKGKDTSVVEKPKNEPPRRQLVSTKNIIEKNLFDPDRGASRALEAEASSTAIQRIRSMILMGTAILGNNRYAILQEPSGSPPSPSRGQTGQPGSLRLKLGDTVEGFRLSEIHDRKVVLTKGASRVEVSLDFFRKLDDAKGQTKAPTQPRPGVAPTVPRKDRLPAPPVKP